MEIGEVEKNIEMLNNEADIKMNETSENNKSSVIKTQIDDMKIELN